MPVRDFVRMMADRPVEAAELLTSIGDILNATGKRLIQKSLDVRAMANTRAARRRSLRLSRRGQQRLELAGAAYRHAQDLFHRAAGHDDLCSADPLRTPLSLDSGD